MLKKEFVFSRNIGFFLFNVFNNSSRPNFDETEVEPRKLGSPNPLVNAQQRSYIMCNRNIVKSIRLDDTVFFFDLSIVKDINEGDINVYYYKVISGIYDLTDDCEYYIVNDENNIIVNGIVMKAIQSMMQ
jgi:hypothetical protein